MGKFTAQNLAAYRVDTDKDGLDDLAIGGDHIEMLRLERMNKGDFWGCVYLRDGRSLRLWFGSKGKLSATIEEEEADSPSTLQREGEAT